MKQITIEIALDLLLINTSIHPGPEKSRQSDLAVFTIEGGLDSKFSYVK